MQAFTVFRFDADTCEDISAVIGVQSFINEIQYFCDDTAEIEILDVALERRYYIETSAEIAAEFDN